MADTELLTIKMRLQDSARTNAQLAETGGAVRRFGNEVELAGKKTAFAAEKSFLLGESMYSLRRYSFYAITALGLTGAGAVKMGLSFDAAKQDAVDALTSITGSTRGARREVNELIRITHRSGLGLGFLTDKTKDMLAFGYSVKQTNAYLGAFANFAGKKGLGEGGVSALVQVFNRVRDTGFLTSRDVRGLEGLGIPANQALGQALGLNKAQMYELRHGQIQIGAGSALPALAGYVNQYANKQSFGFGQLFSILRGDIAEQIGGAETPLFGWLRQKLTGAVTGYNRGGANGALQAVDPTGGLRTFLLALRNGATVVGQSLHAIWVVSRPLVMLFGGLAKVAGIITGNLTAMRLILEPLIGLYVLDRARKLTQLTRDKIVGDRTEIALNGVALAAERAAVSLSLIGGGRGRGTTIIPLGGTSTRVGAAGTGVEAGLAKGGFFGALARRGRGLFRVRGLAKGLGEGALVMGALNVASDPKSNPYDEWTTKGLKHGFGLGRGDTWKQFGQSLGIPGLAGGGSVTGSGWSFVGERGRELQYMPKGASVTPLNSNTKPLAVTFDYEKLGRVIAAAIAKSPPKVYLDGRAVSDGVYDAKQTVEARQ